MIKYGERCHEQYNMEAYMIINTKADYEAASEQEQQRFRAAIAAGINRWKWSGKEWKMEQDTSNLDAFGFTLKDFPDAPKPEKPDYNLDERARDAAIAEAVESRRQAYRAESDAIYFLWQRGEATEQDWFDAVQAIKDRYPKP